MSTQITSLSWWEAAGQRAAYTALAALLPLAMLLVSGQVDVLYVLLVVALAIVASLEDDGPAAKAGVIVGDILTEVDGETITGPDSLRSALASRPGKTATVVLLRGGTRTELSVAIGSRS